MDKTRKLVIACATVIEEMLPLLPPGVAHKTLEFGLHTNPARLRSALQEAIDAAAGQADTIILGYGLCSQGVVGLSAKDATLVVPRVDDCISIFLGSRAAYRQQSSSEPGTLYMTKGWIEAGDAPLPDQKEIIAKYGKERAEKMFALMLKNYKRLAFINTGQYEAEHYRNHAKQMAENYGLRFEEIEGSAELVAKMINGPWGDEFIVVPPGGTIAFEHFFPADKAVEQH